MSTNSNLASAQRLAPVTTKKRSRLPLLAVLAVCVLPVLVSYLMYYVVRPEGRTNYGELFQPVIDAAKLPATEDGQAKTTSLQSLTGKWLMVSAGNAACDVTCVERLYLIRQVRATQGKEMERIERVMLITDAGTLSKEVQQAYDGMRMLRVNPVQLAAALPASQGQQTQDHIYVVDPLGNVVMRFPANPNPSKMKKDVGKLLRASRIG